MQVSEPNNVKIYNFSAGKTLPEWLSERKRRTLQKNDIDIRRRIELIQEFEMPTASTNILVSADKEYVMATGVYKPRVRCYETSQLSMKFERCFDSEVVKFSILSEDYSKMVFLQADRFLEFHVQYGRLYRTRIPKFGRDLAYHYPSCDLYVVGAGSDIYRLNLEQGKFLNPLKTDAVEINVCDFNPVHQLFAAGTSEGRVECWDPRSRSRVGVLDVGLSGISQDRSNVVPSVTTLKYNGGLAMGIGTATGHVLLYDIRSTKPLLIKDHQYGLPIKSMAFQDQLVLSVDSKILKLWDRETGKPFTSIEPQTSINDLCLFPDSGLLFMATEAPKMFVYYIPALGPAPRWCSFLDNLTEELEEDQQPTVYDDYKFVTKEELEKLGLTHLVGTNLLRAYMHGYFMDIRLYQKAKTIAEPFAFEEYRKRNILEKIEEERENRVRIKKLPRINRALAEKLLEEKKEKKKAAKVIIKASDVTNPLGDERFAAMFKNPDFQVDEESEEFRLLHPVISKHDKRKTKRRKELEDEEKLLSQFDEVEELEGRASSDESSSDDEHTWKEEQRRELKKPVKSERKPNKPKFYEVKEPTEFKSIGPTDATATSTNRTSLGERVRREDNRIIRTTGSSVGEMEMTFSLKKGEEETQQQIQRRVHREERKKVRRSAGSLMAGEKKKPVYWRGKRVK